MPAHNLVLVLKIPVVTTVWDNLVLTGGLPLARFLPTSLAGTLLDKIISSRKDSPYCLSATACRLRSLFTLGAISVWTMQVVVG